MNNTLLTQVPSSRGSYHRASYQATRNFTLACSARSLQDVGSVEDRNDLYDESLRFFYYRQLTENSYHRGCPSPEGHVLVNNYAVGFYPIWVEVDGKKYFSPLEARAADISLVANIFALFCKGSIRYYPQVEGRNRPRRFDKGVDWQKLRKLLDDVDKAYQVWRSAIGWKASGFNLYDLGVATFGGLSLPYLISNVGYMLSDRDCMPEGDAKEKLVALSKEHIFAQRAKYATSDAIRTLENWRTEGVKGVSHHIPVPAVPLTVRFSTRTKTFDISLPAYFKDRLNGYTRNNANSWMEFPFDSMVFVYRPELIALNNFSYYLNIRGEKRNLKNEIIAQRVSCADAYVYAKHRNNSIYDEKLRYLVYATGFDGARPGTNYKGQPNEEPNLRRILEEIAGKRIRALQSWPKDGLGSRRALQYYGRLFSSLGFQEQQSEWIQLEKSLNEWFEDFSRAHKNREHSRRKTLQAAWEYPRGINDSRGNRFVTDASQRYKVAMAAFNALHFVVDATTVPSTESEIEAIGRISAFRDFGLKIKDRDGKVKNFEFVTRNK